MVLSPLAADHVQNPRNRGPLDGATHYGVAGSPGDGPYVELWLQIQKGTIRQAAYRTHGCPSSVAASSLLCQLATGRELLKIQQLTGDELLHILGGLPEGKGSLAHLAIAALHNVKER